MATAFFVAAEFALVAADRSRLESLAAEGKRGAKAALAVHRHLSFNLSGAQLGITIVSLVLGFVAQPTLARALEPLLDPVLHGAASATSVVLALALATVLSMVVGELIPKNLVLARPERSAIRLAAPVRIFSAVMGPFIRVANGVANRLVRALGVEPREELASARSLEELDVLIHTSAEEGELHQHQVSLLARSIRFGDKTASDVLVPRLAVTAVGATATVADLVRTAVSTGFSRFPVVGVDLDDVVGVVHVKDIFGLAPDDRPAATVESIMTPALAIPETRPLDDLLSDLQGQGVHLAVVIDEYGGTTGIVTLEDVLEELVGEIDDEYDPATTGARRDPGGHGWILAGTLHEDEVQDSCGFAMPEGDYDTLAGFLLDQLGHIPRPGERVTSAGWTFTVLVMDRLRIASVRATPPEDPPSGEPPSGEPPSGPSA